MKDRLLLISTILFLFSSAEASAVLGVFKIPDDIIVNGQAVPAGMYTISIEENPADAFLELWKGETAVARERAIVLPARGSDNTTTVASVKAGKLEFVRIRARNEDKWYIVYLQIQAGRDAHPPVVRDSPHSTKQ